MSQLTPEQTRLSQRFAALHEGAGQAIDWLDDVRHSSTRVDSEADAMTMALYRARNQATHLAQVAITPMTVGFFGLSQAGKSYLVSALAAGEDGALKTRYGDRQLDFLEDINPVGGGKEATGLVTRFSRAARTGDGEYPVALALFSEVDIAKVLANAWFNDFDHERGATADITAEDVRQHLADFAPPSGKSRPGMTPETVVELQDYLQDSFPKSLSPLPLHFWPSVLALAPTLDSVRRGELLSLLWGKHPEFTRLYQTLAATLGRLGHVSRVNAPLHSLVADPGDDAPHRSIINVDSLAHLVLPGDMPLSVCPVNDVGPGAPVEIPLAQLAALTAELIVPLTEPARDPRVASLDFLDFPGYRGRLSLTDVGEPGGQDDLAQLFLRGKVAYLFERYTDTQQMNGLVVCTSSEKQSDVSDVGPVLDRWIKKTQGANAAERGARTPGLIWALTMLDKRITASLGHSQSQLEEGFEGMIKMTLLERFASYDWLQEWSPGQVFNNTFLVRKPHMPAAFLTLENGYEQAIAPDAADSLALMERTFIDSPGVCRHIHQPADAWKAMLTLGDGGMQRIGAHLEQIAGLDYKLARLNDQLESTLDALTHYGPGRWHHNDDDGEQQTKNHLADAFMQQLQTPALSELLHYMALPDTTLRDLYLSDDDSPARDAEAESPRKSLYGNAGGGFFGQPATPAAQSAPVRESADHRFARAAFNAWVEHMRALPRREGLLHLLELDQVQATVENLCDELITGAHRLGIPEKLSQALLQRVQSGARRDRLVDRHVLTIQLIINDYVAWLGLQELPMDQRPTDDMVSGAPLFGYEADVVLPGEQPTLPADLTVSTDQAKKYLGHWLQAVCHLTRENAGHSGGRELSVAQNERLGHILDTLSGRPVANDTLTHKEPAHG